MHHAHVEAVEARTRVPHSRQRSLQRCVSTFLVSTEFFVDWSIVMNS